MQSRISTNKDRPSWLKKEKEKNIMNKNILVTGAAGFIGANFAEYFVNKHPFLLQKDVFSYMIESARKNSFHFECFTLCGFLFII